LFGIEFLSSYQPKEEGKIPEDERCCARHNAFAEGLSHKKIVAAIHAPIAASRNSLNSDKLHHEVLFGENGEAVDEADPTGGS
jgi:hypothetical protein